MPVGFQELCQAAEMAGVSDRLTFDRDATGVGCCPVAELCAALHRGACYGPVGCDLCPLGHYAPLLL